MLNKEEIIDEYVEIKQMGGNYEDLSELVKDIATIEEVSVPVIRGILVAAKVYVTKPKGTASKSDDVKKEIVGAIQICAGVAMPSLENASKKDLVALWDFIVKSSDRLEVM